MGRISNLVNKWHKLSLQYLFLWFLGLRNRNKIIFFISRSRSDVTGKNIYFYFTSNLSMSGNNHFSAFYAQDQLD